MIVDGYHGTSSRSARKIVQGGFRPSVSHIEWLGTGVYFWQDTRLRALSWAKREAKRDGGEPVVIKAKISLNDCIDLLDMQWLSVVRAAYQYVWNVQKESGAPRFQVPLVPERIPNDRNCFGIHERDIGAGRNHLDCEVMERAYVLFRWNVGRDAASARATFCEGEPIFPSSHLFNRSHVQICIRDPHHPCFETLETFTGDELEKWEHTFLDQAEKNEVALKKEPSFAGGDSAFRSEELILAALAQNDTEMASKVLSDARTAQSDLNADTDRLRSRIHSALDDFLSPS